MRIQLRQTEIEEALQQYIVTQGINLTGKDVKIDFTSSRGEAGLTADVDITNAADGGKHAAPKAVAVETPLSSTEEIKEVAQVQDEPVAEEAAKEPAPASSLFS